MQKTVISSNGDDFIFSSLSVKNPKEITARVKETLLNWKGPKMSMSQQFSNIFKQMLTCCFSVSKKMCLYFVQLLIHTQEQKAKEELISLSIAFFHIRQQINKQLKYIPVFLVLKNFYIQSCV